VSHDREFVSSLANRILEVKDGEVIDFQGSYEEYLASQGIE
jgi:ATPase subunit of ABC transporter with duplicated ATPase domains